MSKKLYTESYIQNIADAIREKNGSTDKYMVGRMAEAIRNISTGADLLALMTGNERFNLTDAETPTEATLIPQYMFYGNQNVHDISYNSIVTVGAYAFTQCPYIGDLNLPSCTEIAENAFLECRRSAAVSASTVFNLPECVTLGEKAFYEFGLQNDNLVINLPKVQTIGNQVFGSYYSTYRMNIKEMNLPKVHTIGNSAFRYAKITDLKFGDTLTSIGTSLFNTATITNLYVYAVTPPTLPSAGLGNAPTHIYVPAASVAAYQGATGWSNYASIIEAIPA